MTDTATQGQQAPVTGTPATPASQPDPAVPAVPASAATDGKGTETEPVIENPKAVLDALSKANKEAETARARVKELEREKLSDDERRQQDLVDARQRADVAEAKATRAEVAAAKGVPLGVVPATGSKEDMEAAADAALAWKGDAASTARPPNPNPLQGAGNQPAPVDADAWLRDMAKRK